MYLVLEKYLFSVIVNTSEKKEEKKNIGNGMNLNSSKTKPAIKYIENVTNQNNLPFSSIANFLISKRTCSSAKNSLSKNSSFNLNQKGKN